MTSAAIDHGITPIPDASPRRAALIAGFSYLALFVLAIFANFVVLGGMLETDDAAATFANIADSPGTFRLGLLAFLVVFILDVVIAWALWVLFKGISRELSRVTAWFRLVYTVFLGVGLIFFFTVLQLVSADSWLGAFDQGQLDAQAMLALDAFDAAWLIGLVAFGFHLILLGYLIVRSGVAPRVLGIVMAIAGIAYIGDTVAHGMLASYEDYADVFLAIVAIPSIVGELWFTFWLLLRGGKDTATATGGPR
jgi:hypothetical protein